MIFKLPGLITLFLLSCFGFAEDSGNPAKIEIATQVLDAQFLKYAAEAPMKPLLKFKKVDFSGNASAYKYRSFIADHFSKAAEPNFNERYVLIVPGCGSHCEIPFLVDYETGKVISAPRKSTAVSGRKESRLLVYGMRSKKGGDDGEVCDGVIAPPRLIVFDNNKFTDLGEICSWDRDSSQPIWNPQFAIPKTIHEPSR